MLIYSKYSYTQLLVEVSARSMNLVDYQHRVQGSKDQNVV